MDQDDAAVGRSLANAPLTTLLALDFFISRGAVSVAVGTSHLLRFCLLATSSTLNDPQGTPRSSRLSGTDKPTVAKPACNSFASFSLLTHFIALSCLSFLQKSSVL